MLHPTKPRYPKASKPLDPTIKHFAKIGNVKKKNKEPLLYKNGKPVPLYAQGHLENIPHDLNTVYRYFIRAISDWAESRTEDEFYERRKVCDREISNVYKVAFRGEK